MNAFSPILRSATHDIRGKMPTRASTFTRVDKFATACDSDCGSVKNRRKSLCTYSALRAIVAPRVSRHALRAREFSAAQTKAFGEDSLLFEQLMFSWPQKDSANMPDACACEPRVAG